jgi:hypothetical protein
MGLPLHGYPKVGRLRRLLHFLFEELGHNLIDDLIDQGAHLVWCLWLDWMGDENWLVLRQS